MSYSDADRFEQITAKLAPHRGMLGIIVDDRVIEAPTIEDTISGPTVEIVATGPEETAELFHRIR